LPFAPPAPLPLPFAEELGDGDGLDEGLDGVVVPGLVVPEPDEVAGCCDAVAGCWDAVAGCWEVVAGATDAPEDTDPVLAVLAVLAARCRAGTAAGPSGRGACVTAEGFTAGVALGVASGTATSPDAGWT
jgi:hypothetical protein